jgi:hypothetical protein
MLAVAKIAIQEESWATVADEADALAAAHFKEVDEGVEPRRPYKLAKGLMAAIDASGALSITAARDASGALIGYCVWIITPDVESEGLTIAQHGPWYVSPDHPGVGVDMLKASIASIKKRGVNICYPHHRLQGRGARLGTIYRRLGAVEIQHTYSLWIGD